MNMFTKFQVDIIDLRTPAAPHTRRRILLSSTVDLEFCTHISQQLPFKTYFVFFIFNVEGNILKKKNIAENFGNFSKFPKFRKSEISVLWPY